MRSDMSFDSVIMNEENSAFVHSTSYEGYWSRVYLISLSETENPLSLKPTENSFHSSQAEHTQSFH